MSLICACVKKLKEIDGDDLEINIQYEDQPFNEHSRPLELRPF